MRKLMTVLLASTALLPQAVFAAEAADAAEAEASEIVVLGKGETRQVQEVKAADIAVLLPGTSAIRAIEKLPSVNIQAADPFGNYEWSTRVTIRSFNQNQLGFTFDGIPLGDMSYGNHNGLHISRVISPENIGSVRVSQGAGSIGTQSGRHCRNLLDGPAGPFRRPGQCNLWQRQHHARLRAPERRFG